MQGNKKAAKLSCNCLILKWAHLGLNQGPPDYESGIFVFLYFHIAVIQLFIFFYLFFFSLFCCFCANLYVNCMQENQLHTSNNLQNTQK